MKKDKKEYYKLIDSDGNTTAKMAIKSYDNDAVVSSFNTKSEYVKISKSTYYRIKDYFYKD